MGTGRNAALLAMVAAVTGLTSPAPSPARRPTSFLAVRPATGATVLEYDPAGLLAKPFPTGSLIKVFTLIAAFRQNPSMGDFRVDCGRTRPGTDAYDGCWFLPGHGTCAAEEALAWSCNRYFRVLGEQINPAVFWKTLADFGLIEEQQAASCMGWSGRDAIEAMIGLSSRLRVPPRQLLLAYCAIANGGFLFVPGDVTIRVRRVDIDPVALRVITDGMRQCCAYGSGSGAARQADEPLAGKTGTAAYCLSGKVFAGKTHGLFIGFSPAVGDPETGVIVFSLEGTGSGAAGTAEPILSVLRLLKK